MDKIEFSTFPKNKADALTLLYLSKQDLRELTPAQLADEYTRIHKEIFARLTQNTR